MEVTPWLVKVTETGWARPGRDSVCEWIGWAVDADAQAPLPGTSALPSAGTGP